MPWGFAMSEFDGCQTYCTRENGRVRAHASRELAISWAVAGQAHGMNTEFGFGCASDSEFRPLPLPSVTETMAITPELQAEAQRR